MSQLMERIYHTLRGKERRPETSVLSSTKLPGIIGSLSQKKTSLCLFPAPVTA
jgi:hypothetical protein